MTVFLDFLQKVESPLSEAMQSPTARSEFPFTFNIFGVLVELSPGEGAGWLSCKGVLQLAPQMCWTTRTHFCFIKYDMCELASDPAVVGITFTWYLPAPSFPCRGGVLLLLQCLRKRLRTAVLHLCLCRPRRRDPSSGAALPLHAKQGQRKSTL